jgi:hypothetical protein
MATHPRHAITGEGQGGRRPGAGRPKGSLGRRSRARELLARVKAEVLELPVDRLLRRMNDPTLSEEYRDQLAIALGPYTAPRLSAVTIKKRPNEMTDEEIAELLNQAEGDAQRSGNGGRDPWRPRVH